jgi:hypothetical protein
MGQRLQKYVKAWVPQVSVLSTTLYSMYINYTPKTLRVYLALFSDDTFMYATGHEDGYVLKTLQRGLNLIQTAQAPEH